VTPIPAQRLPAPERRQALIRAALRVFASGSYAGATTAEIAREAGVSEPILYRHFVSKRELYFACLEAAWDDLRERFESKVTELGEANAIAALGITLFAMRKSSVVPPNLWMQAITEAGEDPEIRKYLRRHARELHGFIADVIRRGQAAGGVAEDRDPEAEAWIFVAGSLLVSVGDRLGGVVDHEQLLRVARARHKWLTGRDLPLKVP
jgi:AcrR family transcriptional regulator